MENRVFVVDKKLSYRNFKYSLYVKLVYHLFSQRRTFSHLFVRLNLLFMGLTHLHYIS